MRRIFTIYICNLIITHATSLNVSIFRKMKNPRDAASAQSPGTGSGGAASSSFPFPEGSTSVTSPWSESSAVETTKTVRTIGGGRLSQAEPAPPHCSLINAAPMAPPQQYQNASPQPQAACGRSQHNNNSKQTHIPNAAVQKSIIFILGFCVQKFNYLN